MLSQNDILAQIQAADKGDDIAVERKRKSPSSTETFFNGSKNPDNFFAGKNVTNGLIPNRQGASARMGGLAQDILATRPSTEDVNAQVQNNENANSEFDSNSQETTNNQAASNEEVESINNTTNNTATNSVVTDTTSAATQDVEVQAALEHSRKIRESIFGASKEIQNEAKLIKSSSKSAAAKVLWWDRTGWCLFLKKLSSSRFRVSGNQEVLSLELSKVRFFFDGM